MKRTILILILLAVAGVLVWQFGFRSHAVSVPFARVARETLVSTLETNGKVEPSEWVDVHAERSAAIQAVLVQQGQAVAQGEVLIRLESAEARADLAVAESRIAQVQAELQTIAAGGRAGEITEIENGIQRAQLDLQVAEKDLGTLKRLQARNAATAQEVSEAQNRVDQAQTQIRALGRRRSSLVSQADRTTAEARLRDAQAAAQLARERLAMATIHSPIAGVVFNLPVRKGSYVASGSVVASIGKTDRVRVTVYVDEPELGRVAAGMPVTISWDALPGKQWTGSVDRTPTQVTALGTRQVGEVLCLIDNPGRELLPGTNVNARIRSHVVEQALTMPKEALRRQGGSPGVYVFNGTKVAWKPVTTGISSVTRVEVTSGLAQGDSVALATDQPLSDGLEVRATYP